MCLRGNADRRKTPVQPCIDEKLPSLNSATKILNHYDTTQYQETQLKKACMILQTKKYNFFWILFIKDFKTIALEQKIRGMCLTSWHIV